MKANKNTHLLFAILAAASVAIGLAIDYSSNYFAPASRKRR
jgi:hypothetical protein